MAVSEEKATITATFPSRTVASRSARRTSVTRPRTCNSWTSLAPPPDSVATGVGGTARAANPGPPTASVRTWAVGSGESDASAVAAGVSGAGTCTAIVGRGETAG